MSSLALSGNDAAAALDFRAIAAPRRH